MWFNVSTEWGWRPCGHLGGRRKDCGVAGDGFARRSSAMVVAGKMATAPKPANVCLDFSITDSSMRSVHPPSNLTQNRLESSPFYRWESWVSEWWDDLLIGETRLLNLGLWDIKRKRHQRRRAVAPERTVIHACIHSSIHHSFRQHTKSLCPVSFESFCCKSETNRTLYVNYTSIKKRGISETCPNYSYNMWKFIIFGEKKNASNLHDIPQPSSGHSKV